jgi:hypothetical protein
MNQIANFRVELRALTGTEFPYGNAKGREVFSRLNEIVSAHTNPTIFQISLVGIEGTDASFPRESVFAIARLYRDKHWFYLTDVRDRDLADNWKYAAQAQNQPLVIWRSESDFEVIGPEISPAAKELLNYVLDHGRVGTSQVAADLGISVPNASTRLKKLVSDGYLLRREDTADTGGVEYIYMPIRQSA